MLHQFRRRVFERSMNDEQIYVADFQNRRRVRQVIGLDQRSSWKPAQNRSRKEESILDIVVENDELHGAG